MKDTLEGGDNDDLVLLDYEPVKGNIIQYGGYVMTFSEWQQCMTLLGSIAYVIQVRFSPTSKLWEYLILSSIYIIYPLLLIYSAIFVDGGPQNNWPITWDEWSHLIVLILACIGYVEVLKRVAHWGKNKD